MWSDSLIFVLKSYDVSRKDTTIILFHFTIFQQTMFSQQGRMAVGQLCSASRRSISMRPTQQLSLLSRTCMVHPAMTRPYLITGQTQHRRFSAAPGGDKKPEQEEPAKEEAEEE